MCCMLNVYFPRCLSTLRSKHMHKIHETFFYEIHRTRRERTHAHRGRLFAWAALQPPQHARQAHPAVSKIPHGISMLRSQHIRQNAHNARKPAATSPIAGRPSTQRKRLSSSMSKTPVRLDVPTSNVVASILIPHTSCVGVCNSPATLVPLVASVRSCSNNPFIKLLPQHGPFIATHQARRHRVEVV